METKTRMVTVTMPADLVKKIDKEAKENRRSRSNQIAIIVAKHYEEVKK